MPRATGLGQTTSFDNKDWQSVQTTTGQYGWIQSVTSPLFDEILVADQNGVNLSIIPIGSNQTTRDAAIVSAFNALDASEGNRMLLPRGQNNYFIDPITLTSRRLKMNFGGNSLINKSAGQAHVLRIDGTSCVVENGYIENLSSSGLGICLSVGSSYNVIRGIQSHRAGQNGATGPFGIVEGSNAVGNVVDNCHFSRMHGGILMNGHGWTIKNCTFHSIHGHSISCNNLTAGGKGLVSNVDITFDEADLAFLDSQDPGKPGETGGINFDVMNQVGLGDRWGGVILNNVTYTRPGSYTLTKDLIALKFEQMEFVYLNNVLIDVGDNQNANAIIVNFNNFGRTVGANYRKVVINNSVLNCQVKFQGGGVDTDVDELHINNSTFSSGVNGFLRNPVLINYGVNELIVDGMTVNGNDTPIWSGAIRTSRCLKASFKNVENNLLSPFFLPGGGFPMDINNVRVDNYKNPNGAPFTRRVTTTTALPELAGEQADDLLRSKRPGASDRYTMTGTPPTVMSTGNTFWEMSAGGIAESTDPATVPDHRYDGSAWQPISSAGSVSATEIILTDGTTRTAFNVGSTEASRRTAWETFVTAANAMAVPFSYSLPPNVTFKINDSVLTFSRGLGDHNGCRFENNSAASAAVLTFSGSRNQVQNFSIKTNGTGGGKCVLVSGSHNEFSRVRFLGTTVTNGATFHDTGIANVYRENDSLVQFAPMRLSGKNTVVRGNSFYNWDNGFAIRVDSNISEADFTIEENTFLVENQGAGYNRGFIDFATNIDNGDRRAGNLKVDKNIFRMPAPTNDQLIALVQYRACKSLSLEGNEWDVGTSTTMLDAVRLTGMGGYTGPLGIESLTICNETIPSRFVSFGGNYGTITLDSVTIDTTKSVSVRAFESLNAESIYCRNVTFRMKTAGEMFNPLNQPKITLDRCKVTGNNVIAFVHSFNFKDLVKIGTLLNENGASGQKWMQNVANNEFFGFKVDGTENLYRWEPGLMSQGTNATIPPPNALGVWTNGAVTFNQADPTGVYFYRNVAGTAWVQVDPIGPGSGASSIRPILVPITGGNLSGSTLPQTVTLPESVDPNVVVSVARNASGTVLSNEYSISGTALTWSPPDANPLASGDTLEIKILE